MQLTLGILAKISGSFLALAFSQLDGFAVPTPAQVRQAVGQIGANMDFYSIFFWWLMGAISGAVITAILFGNFIVSAIKKGEMKMKDKNGEWVSK